MSISLPTAQSTPADSGRRSSRTEPAGLAAPNAPTAASGLGEAPARDGQVIGGLFGLRAELDRIDNALHELLMQRASVVEQVAVSGKPSALRPGREAVIVRRLLACHAGKLPPVTLVRIWRELLAGTTAMQGDFTLAVADAAADRPVIQLAREHFGVLTPLHAHAAAADALADIRAGRAAIAVLPEPAEDNEWWLALSGGEPRLHIIARLPFWQKRPLGAASVQAVVVAATPADASGDDASFVAFECDGDVSRDRVAETLTAAGLRSEPIVSCRDPGHAAGRVLIEVSGIPTEDDARWNQLAPVLRRPVVLGSFAVPIAAAAE